MFSILNKCTEFHTDKLDATICYLSFSIIKLQVKCDILPEMFSLSGFCSSVNKTIEFPEAEFPNFLSKLLLS
jgi:hypothetical protein